MATPIKAFKTKCGKIFENEHLAEISEIDDAADALANYSRNGIIDAINQDGDNSVRDAILFLADAIRRRPTAAEKV